MAQYYVTLIHYMWANMAKYEVFIILWHNNYMCHKFAIMCGYGAQTCVISFQLCVVMVGKHD
jgi:hypothetical protein